MGKRKYVPMRVIQANLLYKMTLQKFMEDLGRIGRANPDLLCLNEVARRRMTLERWAGEVGLNMYMPIGRAAAADTALFSKASRYEVLHTRNKSMTGEPPGSPTMRYCAGMILWDKVSHCFVIFLGTHTIAAVERSNQFNPILRSPYFVQHIFGLILFAMEMRSFCKQQFGGAGQVVLAGDLNWGWGSAAAWISRALSSYFTASHNTLGKVATLGKRAVDVVLKRGALLRFLKQFTIKQNSDHDTLVVDMEIGVIATPPSMLR